MNNPLPPLHWKPTGTYDCPACRGESRRLGTDCPECGGTGWRPPRCPHDATCDDCGRPLWLGGRGPQWFERDLGGEVMCRFCLVRRVKGRRRVNRAARHDTIDLATFTGGDES
ncbi:MAG: hypothetical protein V3T08_09900 [Gemmatimonadota bacterium]